MKTKYNPARGGHAPGYLREALEAALDRVWNTSDNWWDGIEEDDIAIKPEKQKIWASLTLKERGRWLAGQLWNCTDCMPSSLCENIGLSTGSTYAQGVRKLKQELED
ncbi:MAG TPA: hypothetical protein VJL34_14540 [Anaerolineales bacterium]|nr:hypothetical protein [Anaerolineales bacterium]